MVQPNFSTDHKESGREYEKRIPPRSYNMYLLLTTPVALFLLIYGIYKWLKRHSEREKEFWNEQKIYGHPVSLKIYGWLKCKR